MCGQIQLEIKTPMFRGLHVGVCTWISYLSSRYSQYNLSSLESFSADQMRVVKLEWTE